MTKAVFFDVGNPLVRACPSVAETFARVAAERGHALTVRDVEPHMPALDAYYEAEYLRDGDFAPIERILAHNRQDIVSLAQLLCFLCGQVDCPETVESGQDLLSLARSLEKRGDTAKAVKCYRLCARGDTRAEAYHALARERRRAYRYTKRSSMQPS